MAICHFYPRGNCKYGDNCKNEHPGSHRDSNQSREFGNANNNRFSAFGGDRYRPGQSNGSTFGNRDNKPTYNLDRADIKNDLTGQRPIYPLSCYGPSREAPRQLIEGLVEVSPEELRLRYYLLRAGGNEPDAQREEGELNSKMQQQVKRILDDIDGAIKYVEEGANVHPNRIDIAKGNGGQSTNTNTSSAAANSNSNPFMKAPSLNAFSTGGINQTSGFGQISTPGFGRPAFGQPANPAQTTSAFGQPSNPGANASPFGMSSTLGQKPSPFGQPTALGTNSALSKPGFGNSGFGQPSMPGAGSAFGQTSNLGQGSAFGNPSAPGTTSAFGQSNALGLKPSPFANTGFGQTGFGQTSQLGVKKSSPFGQQAQQPQSTTSPFGQQTQSASSPFGQQSQSNASPFGQQTQSNALPFGQQAQSNASPFGQQAQSSTSPFGQQAQQNAQASPFSQQQAQVQKPNPFAQASNQSSSPFAPVKSPQTSVFTQKNQPKSNASPFGTQNPTTPAQPANPFLKAQTNSLGTPGLGLNSPLSQSQTSTQQLSSALAQQVQAGDARQVDPKERVKEGRPEEYEGEQGRLLEEIYRRVGRLGHFNDDELVPLTPPKAEWITPVVML